MTADDHSYCRRYFDDEEISDLLDEYLDCIREGLDYIKDGVSAADALPPHIDQICEQIQKAIAERIWEEFPALRRDNLADRRHVKELAAERWAVVDHNMFFYP